MWPSGGPKPPLHSMFFFRFLLSVITTLVKKTSPELEAVLDKIRQLRGTGVQ